MKRTEELVKNIYISSDKIEKILLRAKELKAEFTLYKERYESGEIGNVLYDLRINAIFFESGLNIMEYEKEMKVYNTLLSSYQISKCFENIKEEI